MSSMAELDESGRPAPPEQADELATLTGFLDFLRATLDWKTRGVSDEELGRALAPSTMTLGGLLKHLSYVEDYWFSEVMRETVVPPWDEVDWDADPDWDWHSAASESGDALREGWATAVARSRAVLGDTLSEQGGDLGALAGRVSIRWILTHMIEEYARHCGHADLLRESIDQLVGE